MINKNLEGVSLKIVNKSKEGITLKNANSAKTIKVSWDMFKKNFIMEDDKFHCHATKEYAEKVKELDSLIINAASTSIIMNADAIDSHKKLVYSLMLADYVEKIQKLAECTPAEAISEIQKVIAMAKDPTWMLPRRETPKEYKARKKREKEQDKTVFAPSSTMSMADVPGMEQLKNMFNK